MADDPVPPAGVLAQALAHLELAQRRFELLERRVASWESRLAQIEALVGGDPSAPATDDPLRFDDLEARLCRLERSHFARRAQVATPPTATRAGGKGSSAASSASGGSTTARAVVHADWSRHIAHPGESIVLGVTTDGFARDDLVHFLIREVSDAGAPPVALTGSIGEGDRVEVAWTLPAAGLIGERVFTFVAQCQGQEAHAPPLHVSRAAEHGG
ncbi:MAG: hypothetical protein KC620_09730 [Myxococcales bacterium]|nr:hypothetical protein [Myxococcales bacterium]